MYAIRIIDLARIALHSGVFFLETEPRYCRMDDMQGCKAHYSYNSVSRYRQQTIKGHLIQRTLTYKEPLNIAV